MDMSVAGGHALRVKSERQVVKRTVIAVVDDDESVREAVAGLIKSLGHVAIAFERAEDFLKLDRGRIAALIADVQMPGITGPQLHARLVESGEPIPTILMTAYPDQVVRARALQNGVKCYLTKPFREEDLLDCIQSALDS
jgi:FixJ family two-component response regulator